MVQRERRKQEVSLPTSTGSSTDRSDEDTRADIVTAWDMIADAYQDRYRIPTCDLHLGPNCPFDSELGVVGDVEGLRVLEVGCGGGQNLIYCASVAAQRIVGVDPSAQQLRFVRRLAADNLTQSQRERLELHCLQARDIHRLRGEYDLILSVYALMYQEDLTLVMDAAFRLLTPGGALVISVDHPLRLSGEWGDDGRFAVENYFASGWQRWPYDFPERGLQVTMARYHRTFSQWITALRRAGFAIDRVLEPLPPADPDRFGLSSKHGSGSPKNVFSSERLCRVPGTLILRAIRP